MEKFVENLFANMCCRLCGSRSENTSWKGISGIPVLRIALRYKHFNFIKSSRGNVAKHLTFFGGRRMQTVNKVINWQWGTSCSAELSPQRCFSNAPGRAATGKCRLCDNEQEVTPLPGPGGSVSGRNTLLCSSTSRPPKDAWREGGEQPRAGKGGYVPAFPT